MTSIIEINDFIKMKEKIFEFIYKKRHKNQVLFDKWRQN